MTERRGLSIHITGIVQGVGFRPFVYNLATQMGVTGWVRNTSAGVDIEVDGEPRILEQFLIALKEKKPTIAKIDQILIQEHPANGFKSFEILDSEFIPEAFQPISPDIGICDECHNELFDPSNRRYLYPFINCTNCGPRFTIIKDIPYDRPNTTMQTFEMCDQCRAEYNNPLDRRFHAQPIACPSCGPHVWMEINDKVIAREDSAIQLCRQLLLDGKIVAIKGLGGFHLACDATNTKAVFKLRERKLRVDKPFAVMMGDIDSVNSHCYLNEFEKHILLSRERPIVILKKRPTSTVVNEVAPNQNTLGVMLPYTPLHYLLFFQESKSTYNFTPPLVMTSGNLSEEPISKDNDEAKERLNTLADAFLMHNREIFIRCDDSVVSVLPMRNNRGNQIPHTIYPIRRSRGYAPHPIQLPWNMPSILATGAELKNTFCMTKDQYAFLSHHIGDLENLETFDAFEKSIAHYERLFRINPQYIAYDLHPDYLATQYAVSRSRKEGKTAVGVQHHHAHIAACLAENESNLGQMIEKPVLGFAFDGTGFGDDGAIWGGEVLFVDYHEYQRIYHLEYIPLPGGDAAIREPWRIAIAWLLCTDQPLVADLPPVKYVLTNQKLPSNTLSILEQQVKKQINAPLTSSMGRLFDAVASIVGVRQVVNYEAQAAIELEMRVDPIEKGSYPVEIVNQTIHLKPLFHALVTDVCKHVPTPIVAARFHNTLVSLVVSIAEKVRNDYGIHTIALSGGVWQNITLLEKSVEILTEKNFDILIHRQVPTNDGGISLGQAVIASHKIGQFER